METHKSLVEGAGIWLRKFGCQVVLEELVAYTPSGESADAIGWKFGYSILIECKASRADFHSDKKKVFRRIPSMGVGTYRLYMCPPNVITVNDLPEGWGLIWREGRKAQTIVGPQGDCNYIPHDSDLKPFEFDMKGEIAILLSQTVRLQAENRTLSTELPEDNHG